MKFGYASEQIDLQKDGQNGFSKHGSSWNKISENVVMNFVPVEW